MKQLPTFDFINEYKKEAEESLKKQQKYEQEVAKAEELKKALDYRYETAVKAAVIEGIDNTAELEEINALLEKAERDLSNKKRAQLVARNLNKPKITPQDVDREFRAYQAKYQSEIVEPAAKELLKAKEVYIQAKLEYNRLVAHFNEQARLATYAINPNAVSVSYQVGFKSAQDRRRKTISEIDLAELEQGKTPQSLKPITKPVKGQDGITRFVPVDEESERGNS
jgi:HEPN domain-containing protein